MGLCVLARPILELLYKDPNHSFLLNIMGIAVFFVTIVQISNAVLQAWGNVWGPVLNMFIGGIVKVALNLYLVSKPEININGAPIGTLACYITVMALNIIALKRKTNMKFGFSEFVVKPLITAAATGAAAYFSYAFISSYVSSLIISIFLAICITAVIYFAVLFLIGGVSEDEILLVPKGDKILSILKKIKLI